MVASRTQRQGVVVEILIDHKIGMNHNLESIRIDSTDSDSISVQIANRITMGESIRKASQAQPKSAVAVAAALATASDGSRHLTEHQRCCSVAPSVLEKKGKARPTVSSVKVLR